MAIDSLKEMHDDFMIYAKEVNESRAFPDAVDGLKPGMRAGLYTMFRHGFSSNKPHVKSAKISGAVIAELWPHSDAAIYETIVRMSQPWVNNIPEIDWHGANGSLLGGPQAASSRYTECRLSKAAEDGFFTNIKKNTIDMVPNFSEDDEWPRVFPAIFPRLFVNGSQGIGYTIAQEWEPSNLEEFTNKVKEYLKTKKVNCKDIYPDYPTGGIIINKDEIKNIYETGRGNIILRGTTEIVNNIIKITALPYQVYVEPFISTVKDLVNDGKLTGIEDIYNKSDDNGMLIEIECSGDPKAVLNNLFRLTDLQCTFSANQMALVNGVPQLLTLKEYIKLYINHNIKCIKKEYQFDLDKASARLEIVDGLLKALADIDNVIATIKGSKNIDDAKKNLVAQGFTDNQAQAIVDMRLGKLAHLEAVELNKEKAELDKKVKEYNKVLGSEKEQTKIFTTRLDAFTDKYKWPRRTQLTNIDIKKEKIKVKSMSAPVSYMVALTQGGELKKVSLADYRPQTKVLSVNDTIVKAVKASNKAKLFLLSKNGMIYKLPVNKIQQGTLKSSGLSVNSLFNDEIINIFTGEETELYLFMITDTGKVKKIKSEDVFSISKKAGTIIMKLKDETIMDSYLVNDGIIEAMTDKGTYQLDTSKFIAKGRSAGGVKGLNLKKKILLGTSLLSL